MEKKSYEAPKCEFTAFEMGDIIATYGSENQGPRVEDNPFWAD